MPIGPSFHGAVIQFKGNFRFDCLETMSQESNSAQDRTAIDNCSLFLDVNVFERNSLNVLHSC